VTTPARKVRRNTPIASSGIAKALGARLRIEREAQVVSLEDFSRAMGVSINKVRWHESGKVMMRADELVQAARILRIEATALMVPHDVDRESDLALRLALGKRLQTLRGLAGKRRHDIIVKGNVSMTDIRLHEEGVRSLRGDQMAAVAEAIGVSAALLVQLDGDELVA